MRFILLCTSLLVATCAEVLDTTAGVSSDTTIEGLSETTAIVPLGLSGATVGRPEKASKAFRDLYCARCIDAKCLPKLLKHDQCVVECRTLSGLSGAKQKGDTIVIIPYKPFNCTIYH